MWDLQSEGSVKMVKVIPIGFIDNTGTGKAHQSNTIYSSNGLCPCLCSMQKRYGGLQTKVIVYEKSDNSNFKEYGEFR
jgi:hypothetical protein